MGRDTNPPDRRSLRLRGYDYALPGAYFVTVCVQNRECLFGEIVGGEMRLNDTGRIVANTWLALPDRFPSVGVGAFVVMPDHVHGIIIVADVSRADVSRAQQAAPLRGMEPARPGVGAGLALPAGTDVSAGVHVSAGAASSAPTLGDVVRAFKSISAISVNRSLGRTGRSLWQRNYYEHVVRGESDLRQILDYIARNPAEWNRHDPV